MAPPMLVQGVDALAHERFNNQLAHGCAGGHMEIEGGASLSMSGESLKKSKGLKSSWSSIFSPKSSPRKSRKNSSNSENDAAMAKFVQGLVAEGRSADNIETHLSHLRDAEAAPAPQSPNTQKKKGKNPFSKFAKALTNALRDEQLAQQYYGTYPLQPPAEAQFLTVSISAAPFYGACPPDMDISFDELSTLEPIYKSGNQCINLLPVTKYDGTPLPGDQTTCTICLGEFEKKEELKSLPCVHFYHKECIDRWLMVGHNCPCCKALVL